MCAHVRACVKFWKLYYANCYLIFLENYLNKWEYFFIFLQNISLILCSQSEDSMGDAPPTNLGFKSFFLHSEHQSSHKEQNHFNIFSSLQKHLGVQS